MRLDRVPLLVTVVILLAGCQSLGSSRPDQYLAMYQDQVPTIGGFQVCHDVGCENLSYIELSTEQWMRLSSNFQVPATSARQERQQLSHAIADFERLVGPLVQTANDQAGNSGSFADGRQLDCVAETVNSTTYLTLFEQQGWLHWHRVALPRHRGLMRLLAPHNTAVIAEKNTGQEYVVDSWFGANAEQPFIVPIEDWLSGDRPDGK